MKRDVYVFNNGTLVRKDNTLLLTIDEKKHYIPVETVESIHFFGEVDVNKSLLEFATQHEILLHYYNYYDYYIGTYYPREHLNSGYVLLQQCEAYLDYDRRRYLARMFVAGATQNMLQILKYYQRRKGNLETTIEEIQKLSEQIDEQETIEQIMAIEGNIHKVYYQAFNVILNQTAFYFSQRSKRPPKDRINALISFGNTIVYNTALSQIYQTQLDPRIGYLHTTNQRRFSLNLDIAELFKPILVDRTIFALLNRKQITAKDFQNELGGILLKDRGRKIFVQAIDEKLCTTVQLKSIAHRVSYKTLIRMEVYKIQKYLTEGCAYEPFVMEW